MTVDDYSPIHVGDTGAPFAPIFQQRDVNGNLIPYPLTGLTISMKMQEINLNTIKTCTGPWTTDDAPGGKAHYQYQATDVDTPGNWTMFIKFTNAQNQVVHSDEKELQILYAP
jgi:hypothetical protein